MALDENQICIKVKKGGALEDFKLLGKGEKMVEKFCEFWMVK